MSEFLQTGAGIVIVGGVAVVCIFWILFPLIIWSQLKEVIRLLKRHDDTLEEIARHTRPPTAAPKSAVRYQP